MKSRNMRQTEALEIFHATKLLAATTFITSTSPAKTIYEQTVEAALAVYHTQIQAINKGDSNE